MATRTGVSEGVQKQALEHLQEIQRSVSEWENMSEIDRAQAALEGKSVDDHVIEHYKRYIAALDDHIKYGNPAWMVTPDK